ncbi:hyaluronan and proteoglycan link protein 1a [Chanos chanos]|uniref:Hyaluronan and proteoglycan link protein 1a n=1 Tax=Chanos chanos TaxID=29144 RepID=A0A6J2WSS0_CHACN|nr:hyaluronan and proteoglycan link protein 1-like [Chanos chanos]
MITILSLALISLNLVNHVYSKKKRLIVFANRGDNVTLPCRLYRTSSPSFGGTGRRVKWTKLSDDDTETDVLVSMGFYKKSYGNYQNRVYLQEADDNDASLVITNVNIDDYGRYRCVVIHGMDDNTVDVELQLQGVVFPYFPRLGRYNFNFHDGERACLEQDAEIASFEQLYEAWRDGLDWCNAGWLSDGTVQYPINTPREPCGGKTGAGVRNYGPRDKTTSLYDVFCFTPGFRGRFYYLIQPERLNFDEAVQACEDDGAEIAKVAHMYAAWKLQGYDRCDAGWLADGSVRYPISQPRRNCSPTEKAVRFVGFPNKKQKLYGVYCYKEQQ